MLSLFNFFFDLLFFFIPFIVPVIVFIIIAYNISKDGEIKLNLSEIFNSETVARPNHITLNQLNLKEKSVVQQILKTNPHFSMEQFKSNTKTAIISVYEGIESLSPEQFRIFETDNLYTRHSFQIEDLKSKGWQQNFESPVFKEFFLVAYKQEAGYEYIKARLTLEAIEYTNNHSSEIVSGSRKYPNLKSIELILKRHQMVDEIQSSSEQTIRNCPACSAPLERQFAQCEFCGHLIHSEVHDWLIDEWKENYKRN